MDGISYLTDDLGDIVAAITAADDDLAGAQVVAEALFNKRLEEWADADRYEELVGPINDLPNRYGAKKPSKTTSRPRTPEPQAVETIEYEEPAAEPTKPDRFAELKARVEGRA